MNRTLVSALDWGLGHTTRMIPVVNQLINDGDEVFIGASERQENIFKEFFPELKFIRFPSAAPVYAKGSSQLFSMVFFLPRFLISIWREHFILRKVVRKYKIERVISDNRYGLYNKAVQSIIVSHQLNILLPKSIKFLEAFVNRINYAAINRFDECWVPDNHGTKSLSGKLSLSSKKINIPIIYKGIFSRFSLVKAEPADYVPEILVIISGPERQRTVFEKSVLRALKQLEIHKKYLIIRGLPMMEECSIPNALNFCSAGKLKTYIQQAKYIICRSGYSSIMDLTFLGRDALLIPTPGQSEQEYLARFVAEKGGFVMQEQTNLDIETALRLL